MPINPFFRYSVEKKKLISEFNISKHLICLPSCPPLLLPEPLTPRGLTPTLVLRTEECPLPLTAATLPSPRTLAPPAPLTLAPPAPLTLAPPAPLTLAPPASLTLAPPASLTLAPPAPLTLAPALLLTLALPGPPLTLAPALLLTAAGKYNFCIKTHFYL